MRPVLLPHSRIPDVHHGHTFGEPEAVIDRLAELVELVDAWRIEGSAEGRAGPAGLSLHGVLPNRIRW